MLYTSTVNQETTFSAETFSVLCDHVAAHDADFARIIATYGYPPMWSRPNTFESLVWTILEQQVSLASAKAALEKLRAYIGSITPEAILTLNDDELKACYFSRQKTGYVRALAHAITSGTLQLETLPLLPAHEIRAQLTAIKGIGNWTADIYLIFIVHHTDIFPLGDLAAVNALRRIKALPSDVSREAIAKLTQAWQPYRAIYTMLLWHYYLSAPKHQK